MFEPKPLQPPEQATFLMSRSQGACLASTGDGELEGTREDEISSLPSLFLTFEHRRKALVVTAWGVGQMGLEDVFQHIVQACAGDVHDRNETTGGCGEERSTPLSRVIPLQLSQDEMAI